MTSFSGLLQPPSTHSSLRGTAPPVQTAPAGGAAPAVVTNFEQWPSELKRVFLERVYKDDVDNYSNLGTFTHSNIELQREVKPLADAAEVLSAIRSARNMPSLCAAIDSIGALDKSLQGGAWRALERMLHRMPLWQDSATRTHIMEHMHRALPAEAPGHWRPAHWQRHRNAVHLLLLTQPGGPGCTRNELTQRALNLLTHVNGDAVVSPSLLAELADRLGDCILGSRDPLYQKLEVLRLQSSPPVAAMLDLLLACSRTARSPEQFEDQLQRLQGIPDPRLRHSMMRAATLHLREGMRRLGDARARDAYARNLLDMSVEDRLTLIGQGCAPHMAGDPGLADAMPYLLHDAQGVPAERILEAASYMGFWVPSEATTQSLFVLMHELLDSAHLRQRPPAEQADVLKRMLRRMHGLPIPRDLRSAIGACASALPVPLQAGVDTQRRIQAASVGLGDTPAHREFLAWARAQLNAIHHAPPPGAASAPVECLNVLTRNFEDWMRPLLPDLLNALERIEPGTRAGMLDTLAQTGLWVGTTAEKRALQAQLIDACHRLPAHLAAPTLQKVMGRLLPVPSTAQGDTPLQRAIDALPPHMRPPLAPR